MPHAFSAQYLLTIPQFPGHLDCAHFIDEQTEASLLRFAAVTSPQPLSYAAPPVNILLLPSTPGAIAQRVAYLCGLHNVPQTLHSSK